MSGPVDAHQTPAPGQQELNASEAPPAQLAPSEVRLVYPAYTAAFTALGNPESLIFKTFYYAYVDMSDNCDRVLKKYIRCIERIERQLERERNNYPHTLDCWFYSPENEEQATEEPEDFASETDTSES